MHVDEFIDDPLSEDRGERYAKFFLLLARLPAWMHSDFREWVGQYKLFCTHKGGRYRVTGASRMGDIWLARDLERESGYDLRVDVDECSGWSEFPDTAYVCEACGRRGTKADLDRACREAALNCPVSEFGPQSLLRNL